MVNLKAFKYKVLMYQIKSLDLSKGMSFFVVLLNLALFSTHASNFATNYILSGLKVAILLRPRQFAPFFL